MSVLRQSRHAAPAFPLDIFGPIITKQIKKAAENAAAPEDFVAAAVLCGAASVIGNALNVEIRPGYVQPSVLWGQVIGLPSSNKSPALRAVTSVLRHLEQRHEPMYLKRYERWKRDKSVAEMHRKEWEGMIKQLIMDGKEVPDDEPEKCKVPPEPNRRQSILNDVTIEAYMRAQARNPRGFMVFRDVLAGWLGNMERHSNEAERGAWLESYDGGSYAIERVKDGNVTTRVNRMCATILGGIQPERLLSITATDKADDGLQARFMPFWPESSFRPMHDGIADDGFITAWFEKLSELTMDKDGNDIPVPYIVRFSKAAFKHFQKWSDDRKRSEMYIHHRLASVYGKSEGQIGRIALNLEYLWWAAEPDDEIDPPETVSLEAVKATIRFRDEYLRHMQRRVFTHSIEPEDAKNARAIAHWIAEEGIEEVNLSKMRREAGIPGISGRTPAEVVEEAASYLVNARWLIPTEQDSKRTKGGRPTKGYVVNPRVFDLLPD